MNGLGRSGTPSALLMAVLSELLPPLMLVDLGFPTFLE
jgi:hypothetical protein